MGNEKFYGAGLNAVKLDLLTSKPNRVCDNLPKTERDALITST